MSQRLKRLEQLKRLRETTRLLERQTFESDRERSTAIANELDGVNSVVQAARARVSQVRQGETNANLIEQYGMFQSFAENAQKRIQRQKALADQTMSESQFRLRAADKKVRQSEILVDVEQTQLDHDQDRRLQKALDEFALRKEPRS